MSWRRKIVEGMADWAAITEALAKVPADPINPRLVNYSLNKRLPENAIVTADAGSTADWYGYYLRFARGQSGNLSGMLASMLAAMPYAVSAKFAHPDRPVICTIGGGAFQMLGMNEMLTVKRHWQEWADPRFVVLVLHNGDLNQVIWETREVGDPRYDTSQLVEDMDYAGYAQLLGLTGIAVGDPGDVDSAWERALFADRPVVVDVHTDPNVPPLPAHISFAEARGFLTTLLKGDPAQSAVVRGSLRAIAAEALGKAKSMLTN